MIYKISELHEWYSNTDEPKREFEDDTAFFRFSGGNFNRKREFIDSVELIQYDDPESDFPNSIIVGNTNIWISLYTHEIIIDINESGSHDISEEELFQFSLVHEVFNHISTDQYLLLLDISKQLCKKW